MTEVRPTDVRARQQPPRERYKEVPQDAWITDQARTTGGTDTDPFHGLIVPGSEDYGGVWPFSNHRAVGGDHDGPNPGDLLCAALAACLDSTIRMIANRLGIHPTSLEVDVTAKVDVRSTPVVNRSMPVGFQAMHCRTHLQAAEGTDVHLLENS